MVSETATAADEARAILRSVSAHVEKGDDTAALRTVATKIGDLLACKDLGTIVSTFDEKTRSIVLEYVEEFTEEAAKRDLERKRMLLALVKDIKDAGKDEALVDKAFSSRKEKMLDIDLLEHVDNEIKKLDEEGAVNTFFNAIRDRLAADLIESLTEDLFGDSKDDVLAVQDVLAEPTDANRLAMLRSKLQEEDDLDDRRLLAQAWYEILHDARDDPQTTDPDIRTSLDLLLTDLESVLFEKK